MDTTVVTTIGDNSREWSIPENGSLILVMGADGKPHAKLLTGEQTLAFYEGLVEYAGTEFQSGSDIEQESFRTVCSLSPNEEHRTAAAESRSN